MPKQKKVCRVCGKTYESCRSIKTGSGVFNWREICCSPECGQTYFQRVQEGRNPASKEETKKTYARREKAVKVAPVPVEVAPVIEVEEQSHEPIEEPQIEGTEEN